MANWLNNYRADRRRLKDRILAKGQRATAVESGMGEMAISRFVRNRGTGSAADLYRIADAVGLTVVVVTKGAVVMVDGELFSIRDAVTSAA
jgi:transcriptional regulator with XRE-family HTH domain